MNSMNDYREVAGFRCLDHIEHQTDDLFLTRCGLQTCTANYSWGPKCRPQFHMHFILEGQGTLEIDNCTYHLKRGEIFLVPPNVESHYCADSKNPWTYAFVSFQGNKAEQYSTQAGFSSSVFVRNCVHSPEKYSSIIHEMLDTHQLTFTNELKRISLLFLMFSLLTASSQPAHADGHKNYDYPSETYLAHAVQYIQLNYRQNIHISDIADYIGITRSYLFHLFSKTLNISPQKYLLSYRMSKAKELLTSTDLSIQEIACQIGYEDPLAFSKMFRSTAGLSPSTYRKQLLL